LKVGGQIVESHWYTQALEAGDLRAVFTLWKKTKKNILPVELLNHNEKNFQ
jgi:hypothetical protein